MIAQELRDEAMQAVDANASDEWKTTVAEGVRLTAIRLREFTTADVKDTLGGEWPDGADPRALGPIMMRQEKAGLIAHTGRYTAHPYRHATPAAIWHSLIY